MHDPTALSGFGRRVEAPKDAPTRRITKSDSRGFTIVELLIVIVIIGILAAITIVAYNGIQQRAKESALKSDLANVAKKMAVDSALNGSYALTAAAVDGGKGLPSSTGTSYQFQSTGSTYCITGTNGNTSFKVSDAATSPSQGGCPGDGVGGLSAVTNFLTNPSAETDAAGIAADTGSPSIARSTARANTGLASFLLTSTSVTTDVAGRLNFSLAPGTYTLSYYVNPTDSRQVSFDWWDSTGATGGNSVGTVALPASTWTRVSGSITIGGTGTHSVAFYLHNRNGPSISGATLYIDSLMLSSGASAYNYADGNSPNWIWNGAPNNSTSTGSAL